MPVISLTVLRVFMLDPLIITSCNYTKASCLITTLLNTTHSSPLTPSRPPLSTPLTPKDKTVAWGKYHPLTLQVLQCYADVCLEQKLLNDATKVTSLDHASYVLPPSLLRQRCH